jgi:hypothetical protein
MSLYVMVYRCGWLVGLVIGWLVGWLGGWLLNGKRKVEGGVFVTKYRQYPRIVLEKRSKVGIILKQESWHACWVVNWVVPEGQARM